MALREILLQVGDDGVHVVTPEGAGVFDPSRVMLAIQRFAELRDQSAADPALDPRDHRHLHRYATIAGDELGRLLFLGGLPPSGTLVRVVCEDRLVLGWPWELARVGDRFAFRDGSLSLVRACERRTDALRPRDARPFSLAVAVATPWPVDDLSHELETLRILNALPFVGAASTEVHGGTLEEIVDAVGRHSALHLVLHATSGTLTIEADDGTLRVITVEQLATALAARERRPSLVFISGCDAMLPPSNEPDRDGILPLLHALGVPDVVGYQGNIADDVATSASEIFYAALARGATPSNAIAALRAALATDERIEIERPFAWTQPCHLQGPEDAPIHVDSRLPRAEPATIGLVGRRATIRGLARSLRDGAGFIFLYGPMGVGRSSLARAVLRELPGQPFTLTLPREEGSEAVLTELAIWAGLPDDDYESPTKRDAVLQWIRERGSSLPGFVVVDAADDLVSTQLLSRVVRALYEGKARAIIATDYFGEYAVRGPHLLVRPLEYEATYRLVTSCPSLGRLSPEARDNVAVELMGMPGPIRALDLKLSTASARAGVDFDIERALAPALAEIRDELRKTWFTPRWAKLLPEHRLAAVRLSVVPRPIRSNEAAGVATDSTSDEPAHYDTLNTLLKAGIVLMEDGLVYVEPAFIEWIAQSPEADRGAICTAAKACAGLLLRAASERFAPFFLAEAAALFFLADDPIAGANIATAASNQCWDAGRADHALEMLDVVPASALAELPLKERRLYLAALGRALRGSGRLKEAEDALTESLALARQAGDPEGEAVALACLGNVALDRDDLRQAKAALEAAVNISAGISPQGKMLRISRGRTLGSLGHLAAKEGDYDKALKLHQEQREIALKEEAIFDAARALSSIAAVLLQKGDVATALRAYEERLDLARQMGDDRGVGVVLNSQGIALLDSGNPNEALEKFTESRAYARTVGDRGGEALGLYNSARVHLALGDAARAITEASKAIEMVPNTGLAKTAHRFRETASLASLVSAVNAEAAKRGLRVRARVQGPPSST